MGVVNAPPAWHMRKHGETYLGDFFKVIGPKEAKVYKWQMEEASGQC